MAAMISRARYRISAGSSNIDRVTRRSLSSTNASNERASRLIRSSSDPSSWLSCERSRVASPRCRDSEECNKET
jgi:hypothetical protein